MNVLVVGAGAIGGLVGGKLARSGHGVTLVGRRPFVESVQRDGLCLLDEQGEHHIRSVTATADTSTALAQRAGVLDAVILTVKSYDTATALLELSAASGFRLQQPLIVSLQNGVGNEELIAEQIGAGQTVAGTLTTPVSTPQPGVIRVDKPRYTMGISPWSSAVDPARFAGLAGALSGAGFDLTVYAAPRSMKWTKLLMNLLGNASSAIVNMTPEEIFADPSLAGLEAEAWREALAVMAAARIPAVNLGGYPLALLAGPLRHAPVGLIRALLRRSIGGARGNKMPSLHIDLHGGKRKSEIDWLNGAVVRLGEQTGVATPVNRVLTETLTRLLVDEAERAVWDHAPARLLDAVDRARRRPRGKTY